ANLSWSCATRPSARKAPNPVRLASPALTRTGLLLKPHFCWKTTRNTGADPAYVIHSATDTPALAFGTSFGPTSRLPESDGLGRGLHNQRLARHHAQIAR